MSVGFRKILFILFSLLLIVGRGERLFAENEVAGISSVDALKKVNPQKRTLSSPKDLGMDACKLGRIGSIVKKGIKAKAFPGCQVLIMKNGKTVYDKCFGNYTYESRQKVKNTTMYDLASLSKTTGTLLAIMKLYDDGVIKLTDKASQYLPFLRGTDKEGITITDLLFHESGLPPYLEINRLVTAKDTAYTVRIGHTNFMKEWVSRTPSAEFGSQVADSFYLNNRFHDRVMQQIAGTPLRNKTYLYSCVNFMMLKEIAETVTGKSLDVFLDSVFYKPMGLKNICYLPLRTHKKDDVAPTIKYDGLRGGMIQGYVHDPDAAFLGGISGNAGLFATSEDVADVYQMILDNGEFNGKQYLSAETCKLFTTTTSASGRRGLGYDKPVPSNPAHSPCCASAPKEVYGHTGYTGTCCWVDPVNNLVYVFLSNRTYPNDGDNKLSKMGIRTDIQEVIYKSIIKK